MRAFLGMENKWFEEFNEYNEHEWNRIKRLLEIHPFMMSFICNELKTPDIRLSRGILTRVTICLN